MRFQIRTYRLHYVIPLLTIVFCSVFPGKTEPEIKNGTVLVTTVSSNGYSQTKEISKDEFEKLKKKHNSDKVKIPGNLKDDRSLSKDERIKRHKERVRYILKARMNQKFRKTTDTQKIIFAPLNPTPSSGYKDEQNQKGRNK